MIFKIKNDGRTLVLLEEVENDFSTGIEVLPEKVVKSVGSHIGNDYSRFVKESKEKIATMTTPSP